MVEEGQAKISTAALLLIYHKKYGNYNVSVCWIRDTFGTSPALNISRCASSSPTNCLILCSAEGGQYVLITPASWCVPGFPSITPDAKVKMADRITGILCLDCSSVQLSHSRCPTVIKGILYTLVQNKGTLDREYSRPSRDWGDIWFEHWRCATLLPSKLVWNNIIIIQVINKGR